MPNSEPSSPPKSRLSAINVVAVGVLALVAYEVWSGIALKKVSILGSVIEFGDRPSAPPAAAAPEVSRDFVIGRWEVEQSAGQAAGGTRTEYLEDGTFSSSMTSFVGGFGQRQAMTGRWEMKKLSKSSFHLSLTMDNGQLWNGTFRIFDQDHIQNTDTNYVATRLR